MDLYAKLSDTMKELSSTFHGRMNQYEDDLRAASSNEASHKTIASLSREFTEFKGLIWKTMSALKTQMELLVLGLDRHEMASRKKVLLLHGLGEESGEDTVSQAVSTLTKRLKIANVSTSDIVACHRLGAPSTKTRPLLIRFESLNLRGEVWRSKTELKETGLILSEFLTKPRHDTFVEARKHFGVSQCWTSEGKIVILLPNKVRRKIESAEELRQLVAQFPAAVSVTEKNAVDPRATTPQPAGKTTSIQDKRSRKLAK